MDSPSFLKEHKKPHRRERKPELDFRHFFLTTARRFRWCRGPGGALSRWPKGRLCTDCKLGVGRLGGRGRPRQRHWSNLPSCRVGWVHATIRDAGSSASVEGQPPYNLPPPSCNRCTTYPTTCLWPPVYTGMGVRAYRDQYRFLSVL